jgi:NADPH-dependent 2,4-dienoyl-CoA reductase/sulfur reductase-like enzyme
MTTTKETYEVKDSSATSTSTSTSTMPTDRRGRIAIIGGGVSGISAAHVWQRCGYEVQIYEASDRIGGQWNESYPGVAVQNTSVQYQFVEYGWPFEPDRHATGEQILDYIDQAVKHFDVRIQLNTLVKNMVKEEKGWTLVVEDTACKTGNLKTRKEKFDYVTIAVRHGPPSSQFHVCCGIYIIQSLIVCDGVACTSSFFVLRLASSLGTTTSIYLPFLASRNSRARLLETFSLMKSSTRDELQ